MQIKTRLATIGITGVLAAAGVSIYSSEGDKTTPYLDGANVPTVCVGSTQKVILGRQYTEAECTARFGADLRTAEAAVNRCTPNLPDASRTAFISFVFNVGEKSYCTSTLAKKANQGDYAGACAELYRWVYIGKEKSVGLYNRRVQEYNLCTGGK